MTDVPASHSGLVVHSGEPLIGIPTWENERQVIHYFSSEQEARAFVTAEDRAAALAAIGSWSDVDYDSMLAALDHIRHDTPPTPPVETL